MPEGVTAFCSDECIRSKRYVRKPKKNKMPKAVRAKVVDREMRLCARCGRGQHRTRGRAGDFLHVHHIKYRSEGGDHTPENLIALCGECHDVVHSNKRIWQPVLLEYTRLSGESSRRPSVPVIFKEMYPDEPYS